MGMNTSGKKGRRRKPVAEINVVPYIDVMLVLLIIFMVTAPLLNLGVDIDLPKSNAKPIEQESDPIVITIDKRGDLHLTLKGERELIDEETLVTKVSAFVRQNPSVQVLIGGDHEVSYGRVYGAMVALQTAGVSKVGLMSDPAGGPN